jgi:plastocyanin
MRATLLAALCLTAVGCGGAPKPTATLTATPTAAVVNADMRHNRFAPPRLVVRLGQTVRWTNGDAVAHTVASQDLHLSSEAIRAGGTFSYRPRRAGRFTYFCTIHAGQTGVLIVRSGPRPKAKASVPSGY